ncbi:hypothetical protein BC832DRAFT_558700 [Gaertneriomyces semiglobifer]|nr:hypothetical protein BC832DRAFT_558700 [Gaertneriomyces semiglobifer]
MRTSTGNATPRGKEMMDGSDSESHSKFTGWMFRRRHKAKGQRGKDDRGEVYQPRSETSSYYTEEELGATPESVRKKVKLNTVVNNSDVNGTIGDRKSVQREGETRMRKRDIRESTPISEEPATGASESRVRQRPAAHVMTGDGTSSIRGAESHDATGARKEAGMPGNDTNRRVSGKIEEKAFGDVAVATASGRNKLADTMRERSDKPINTEGNGDNVSQFGSQVGGEKFDLHPEGNRLAEEKFPNKRNLRTKKHAVVESIEPVKSSDNTADEATPAGVESSVAPGIGAHAPMKTVTEASNEDPVVIGDIQPLATAPRRKVPPEKANIVGSVPAQSTAEATDTKSERALKESPVMNINGNNADVAGAPVKDVNNGEKVPGISSESGPVSTLGGAGKGKSTAMDIDNDASPALHAGASKKRPTAVLDGEGQSSQAIKAMPGDGMGSKPDASKAGRENLPTSDINGTELPPTVQVNAERKGTSSADKKRRTSPKSRIPVRRPCSPSKRTIRSRGGSGRSRVLFPRTRIPVLKARAARMLEPSASTETLLISLRKLAAKHKEWEFKIQPSLKIIREPSLILEDDIPPEAKIQILSERLGNEEGEVQKLAQEKSQLHKQVVTLRRRIAREVERAKPLPKVTSTVPTSVEANLNLRYQFKRILEGEREKYAKLEEENKVLVTRVKEVEAKPTRNVSLDDTNRQKANEILGLRKKLKEAEAEKRELEKQNTVLQKKLEQESKDREKINKEKDAIRQHFTHLATQLGDLTGEPARNSETRKPAAIVASGVRKVRAAMRPGVTRKNRLPSRKLSREAPVVEANPIIDNAKNPTMNNKNAGQRLWGSETDTSVSKPIPVGKGHDNMPLGAAQNNKSEETGPQVDNSVKSAEDGVSNASSQNDNIVDTGIEGNDQRDASASSAPASKSKLPDVFRKPKVSPQRVFEDLDRDLREAGTLIESLDRDITAARQTTKKRRVPTDSVEVIAGVEAIEETKPIVPASLLSSTEPAEPPLPEKQDSETQQDMEARLRSARIRLEYNVWVKKKNMEAVQAAIAEQGRDHKAEVTE